jgi:choline dehydrogenase-like flavoprotein
MSHACSPRLGSRPCQISAPVVGTRIGCRAVGESLPNDKSRVGLDPDHRDRYGVPLPRISAYLEPGDIARLRFMATKSRELLAASGAEDIFETYSSWDWFGATHVFGTCRMGTDPSNSVVNGDGRSHRWRNLWITDAGVFPSSGGGEAPSLTIQALALRTADLLARSR